MKVRWTSGLSESYVMNEALQQARLCLAETSRWDISEKLHWKCAGTPFEFFWCGNTDTGTSELVITVGRDIIAREDCIEGAQTWLNLAYVALRERDNLRARRAMIDRIAMELGIQ